jgi:hypothetical protein
MKELNLPPRLMAILAQEYPRFSDAEFARRHKAIAEVMAKTDLDHVVASTDHRTGNVTQWVTGWPAIQEAYTVLKPGEPMTMFLEWWNHFPLASKLARGVDVHWGEHRGIAKTIEELKRRGARRIGVMGPLHVAKWRHLEEHFLVQSLDADYVRLRLIKSEEEIDWLRIGAALSDRGLASLRLRLRATPGDMELHTTRCRRFRPVAETGPSSAGSRYRIFPLGMVRALAPFGGSVIAPVGIRPAALFLPALPLAGLLPTCLRAFFAIDVAFSRRAFSSAALRTAVAIRAIARCTLVARPRPV